MSGIDCGWSGDWSRFGFVSVEVEEVARNAIISIGCFHLFFCVPIAAITTWQRSQPIFPAVLKVSLVGFLALMEVVLQPDDRAIQFPWVSKSNGAAGKETLGNTDGFVQLISRLSQFRIAASFKQLIANAVAGQYDSAVINSTIDDFIEKNSVAIFSWRNCPFCKKAKYLLIDELGANAGVLELDDDKKTGDAIRAELGKRTGRTSVPSIWIGGEFVGGYKDGPGVLNLQLEGKLRPLLIKSGALVETSLKEKL